MKLSRVRQQPHMALVPLNRWTQSVRIRLLGEDATISIDGLDASIRALAVATVLVLSLLGYGRADSLGLGVIIDPVWVALGLVAYNLIILGVLGVPWRHAPGFGLFVLDLIVVSAAIVISGGVFSPFLILYYALIIGAALRLGLSRSLLLVTGCAVVYAALSTTQPTSTEPFHLPVLAVGITSLLMVAVTSVALKRSAEVEARKGELEEQAAAQLRVLNNLTRVVLSGSPDLERVMRTVAAVSSRAVQGDSGLAVLVNSPRMQDDVQLGRGERRSKYLIVADDDPDPAKLSAREEQVMAEAARTQAPVLISSGSAPTHDAEPEFPGLLRAGVRVSTVACVPFLLSGGVIGALFVGRQERVQFTESEVYLLTAIGQQMAVAVRLARLYEHERERASRSEEREQLERDLLSIVSHELRTPLTSIKTCVGALSSIEEVDTVASADPQEQTRSKLLQNIGRSTDRLITLVNESLDMARLRARRVSLNLQTLNMGDVVAEMAGHVRPLLDARQQTLVLDLPATGSPRWEALMVDCDRRRIEQVLLNLLANANKYSPPGGKITLGATPKDGQVRVFVRDEGPGIPADEQEHIFEKFYQVTPSPGSEQKPDGSGLGLAIARSIVELHGGEIGVRSGTGRGSTFFFTLPAETFEAGRVAQQVGITGGQSARRQVEHK